MTFSDKIDNILGIGISLHGSHIHNWALTKEQCLEVLKKFKEINVAILGGDVMDKTNGQIGFSSASWHCDKRKDEEYENFVKRSIDRATEYVTNYPTAENIYFILVPG